MARKRQQSITTDGRYAQKQYLRNLSGVTTPENSNYSKVNADNSGALRAQNAGEYHAMREQTKSGIRGKWNRRSLLGDWNG